MRQHPLRLDWVNILQPTWREPTAEYRVLMNLRPQQHAPRARSPSGCSAGPPSAAAGSTSPSSPLRRCHSQTFCIGEQVESVSMRPPCGRGACSPSRPGDRLRRSECDGHGARRSRERLQPKCSAAQIHVDTHASGSDRRIHRLLRISAGSILMHAALKTTEYLIPTLSSGRLSNQLNCNVDL